MKPRESGDSHHVAGDSSLESDGPADPKMGAGARAAVFVENGPKTHIVAFRIWARLLVLSGRFYKVEALAGHGAV